MRVYSREHWARDPGASIQVSGKNNPKIEPFPAAENSQATLYFRTFEVSRNDSEKRDINTVAAVLKGVLFLFCIKCYFDRISNENFPAGEITHARRYQYTECTLSTAM